MLQRIQTVFLLLSSFAIASLFFIPIVKLMGVGEAYCLDFNGIFNMLNAEKVEINTITVLILLSIIQIISLLSVIVYKNRVMQIRLIVFNILLLIGLIILAYFISFQASKDLGTKVLVYSSAVTYIPVVSIIFYLIAIRSIRKDEKLVKSYDRIR